jgi:hypothetical protein
MHLQPDGNWYTPTGLWVDTVVPLVTSVEAPASGTYKAGDYLGFTVHFSEPVTVPVSASLELQIGGHTWYAQHNGGTGDTALHFEAQVPGGWVDSDGIEIADLLGTVESIANGRNADLTLHGVGSTASVLVDARGPTVTSVDVPAPGFYDVGDELDLVVHFDENVDVT